MDLSLLCMVERRHSPLLTTVRPAEPPLVVFAAHGQSTEVGRGRRSDSSYSSAQPSALSEDRPVRRGG